VSTTLSVSEFPDAVVKFARSDQIEVSFGGHGLYLFIL